MKKYRIEGGVAHVGIGEVIEITEAQYKPRAHNVDLMERTGDRFVARAKHPLDFKAGEIVGLAADPPKPFLHLFVDLDAPAPAKAASVEGEAPAKSARRR